MIRHLTSLQNPLIKHLVKLRTDRQYRYEQQSVIIEGVKPIREFKGVIKRLMCLEETNNTEIQANEKWIVSEPILKKISGMSSSEGLLAEIAMPNFATLIDLHWILVLDGINDPGNLGTLLRTAIAFGWEGVFLLPNSCDPFNEKVIRAARGAQFKLPMRLGSEQDLKQLVQKTGLPAWVADLDGQKVETAIQPNGAILVLGSEARGPSEQILNLCSKVTIPMSGAMESLNVAIAGGILMYVLKRDEG